jgi:hypothetical protein
MPSPHLKPIPLPLQTLFADLAQQVEAADGRGGTVYRREVKGAEYLYAKIPVGEGRHDRFIGRADDPEAAAAAARIEAEAVRAAERRDIVRMLRGRGLPGPTTALGRVMDAFAYAGLFEQGAVLVGTAAYQCYGPLVGYHLPSSALMTQDADLATASLALSSADEGGFEAVLKRADRTFTAVPGLDPRRPPSRFRSASGFLVDLLTPQRRRSDRNPMPLPNLDAGAVPLQHLSWLLEAPIRAVALHGPGVPALVPQPARYAVHKLIVAQKRKGEAAKRAKDLVQARALIEALREADPYAVSDALAEAKAQGQAGWARPIERSLAELGLEADPAEVA